MSELSDYRTVEAEELAESAAANGTNGAHPSDDAARLGVAAHAMVARGQADTWGSNLPALRLAVGTTANELVRMKTKNRSSC